MITRFAPAPTGHLHLGHVVNALHVWGAAHDRDGRVLLRIEDHDRQRSRPEYEASILEDLAWLGFTHDGPMVRQSERDALYRKALQPLIDRELVFGCSCSRAEIGSGAGSREPGAGSREPGAGSGEPGTGSGEPGTGSGEPGTGNRESGAGNREPGTGSRERGTGNRESGAGNRDPGTGSAEIRYPGTCRDLGIPLVDGVAWRVQIDPGVERFFDELLGPQEQDPSRQCGDVVVRDRHGNWTYQFAVTVDDHLQGVTDVIRGVDLLDSTGRQLRLARLIGRPHPPRFRHHPLVMKSATQKLSKSDGDSGVRDLRARGWTAAQVLDRARGLSDTLRT